PVCLHSFPTRRSSDLFFCLATRHSIETISRGFLPCSMNWPRRRSPLRLFQTHECDPRTTWTYQFGCIASRQTWRSARIGCCPGRSEEHTSELQSRENL